MVFMLPYIAAPWILWVWGTSFLTAFLRWLEHQWTIVVMAQPLHYSHFQCRGCPCGNTLLSSQRVRVNMCVFFFPGHHSILGYSIWMRGDGKHEMVALLHQPIWTWEILWVVRTTNQLSPGRKLEMTTYPPENTHMALENPQWYFLISSTICHVTFFTGSPPHFQVERHAEVCASCGCRCLGASSIGLPSGNQKWLPRKSTKHAGNLNKYGPITCKCGNFRASHVWLLDGNV